MFEHAAAANDVPHETSDDDEPVVGLTHIETKRSLGIGLGLSLTAIGFIALVVFFGGSRV